MENPIKMDDLRVPLFLETPKWPKAKIDVIDVCESSWSVCPKNYIAGRLVGTEGIFIPNIPM